MVDHQPPRAFGDELEVLLAGLQFQRESFLRKVEGLSEQDARRVFVPSGMTLLWLTKHLAFAEQIWLRSRVMGETDLALSNELEDGDTVASVVAAYRAVWPITARIVEEAGLDRTFPDPNGGPTQLDVRWVLVHLIQEVARHAGHADVLRELIDGEVGR